MKKKLSKKLSILLICALGLFLVACGTGNDPNADENVGIEEEDTANGSGAMTGSETGTGNGDVVTNNAGTTDNTGAGTDNAGTATNNAGTTNNGDANTNTTAGQPGTPAASEANPINDKITGYYSETIAYPALEAEIIDELDYENMDMTSTRYYYNYVDLNDDGIDEIIVQLNGDYSTTKNGDTLLIVEQEREYDENNEDDGFDVEDKFITFANPVIVSDNKTNGYKDLIFMNPDGTYSKVEYGRDGYKKLSEAVKLKNIDNITGVALLCNDVAADTENNTGIFFS